MEMASKYVKPELLGLSVVLYFIGLWIKQSELIKDKYIPLVNGAVGIILCALYVLSTVSSYTFRECILALFMAVTQGILVAGLSTYANQIGKQISKTE